MKNAHLVSTCYDFPNQFQCVTLPSVAFSTACSSADAGGGQVGQSTEMMSCGGISLCQVESDEAGIAQLLASLGIRGPGTAPADDVLDLTSIIPGEWHGNRRLTEVVDALGSKWLEETCFLVWGSDAEVQQLTVTTYDGFLFHAKTTTADAFEAVMHRELSRVRRVVELRVAYDDLHRLRFKQDEEGRVQTPSDFRRRRHRNQRRIFNSILHMSRPIDHRIFVKSDVEWVALEREHLGLVREGYARMVGCVEGVGGDAEEEQKANIIRTLVVARSLLALYAVLGGERLSRSQNSTLLPYIKPAIAGVLKLLAVAAILVSLL